MTKLDELYAQATGGHPVVLLVDDDANILDTMKDILEEAGLVIHTASNGAAALKTIEEETLNVVVVDFQLPDLTGLELARKVREHNEHTLVILMTGHASLEMAVKAIQEAVYDYLIKPVDPAQLQRTIDKAVEKQRLLLENRQLLNDLKRTNEAMARLDSLKSKMLSVMSHDLRTPLSSIRGYSELLKSGVKGKLTESQKQMMEIIIQESDHLNGLIGDLLDLASIEAGRFHLDQRPGTIEEVVKKALPRARMFAEMKEIPLEVSIAPSLPTIEIDPPRLVQVISNLLRNAIKHAARGGKVVFDITRKDGMVEARITQAGTGFSTDQLQSLFSWSKNYASADGDGMPDGLRISLAIAREIVHAHGGQIGVESTGVERGSTFWLKLPVMTDGK